MKLNYLTLAPMSDQDGTVAQIGVREIHLGNRKWWPAWMSKPSRARYKTTNWRDYNLALKWRGSLTIWLNGNAEWSSGGAPAGLVIQTCLTMKVLFGMTLRQASGFVESLLQLIGLVRRVADFSTLCRRQKALVIDIASRIKVEGEWHARKHGVSSRRVWRKIQLANDERTLEVCAAEVTSSNVGDAPDAPRIAGQVHNEHGA